MRYLDKVGLYIMIEVIFIGVLIERIKGCLEGVINVCLEGVINVMFI